VLTWRLVHEIENEALGMLERSSDLDSEYIQMVRSSRWGYVPDIDEPADLDPQQELPVALTLIQHAYHTSH
jgi:hypothetical protein